MEGVATQGDLLERLRSNEARNSTRLKAIGFLGETPSVRCSRCGLYEALLFWDVDESRRSRSTSELRFRCPNGCGTQVKYDPAEEAVSRPPRRARPMLANWVLVPIVLYALYGYTNTTDVGRSFVAQLWASSVAQFSQLGITGLAAPGGEVSPVAPSQPGTP